MQADAHDLISLGSLRYRDGSGRDGAPDHQPQRCPGSSIDHLYASRFERYFARMAAENAGDEPPDWALQPIPGVTRVGPPIAESSRFTKGESG